MVMEQAVNVSGRFKNNLFRLLAHLCLGQSVMLCLSFNALRPMFYTVNGPYISFSFTQKHRNTLCLDS
jgi:hypothetical protein